MKKVLLSVFLVMCVVDVAMAEKFISCGPGYILVKRADIDGIDAAECQKLWCRDLENGKNMGSTNRAASGYKTTSMPLQLCDAQNNCIDCFGNRKWCAGDVAGIWNAEYGAYTRGGEDNSTYTSYLKGSCYSWRLEKPDCPSGETAILRAGQWVCATSQGSATASRASSIRRTGTTLRRGLR